MNDYSFIDLFPEDESGEQSLGMDYQNYNSFNPANPGSYRSQLNRENDPENFSQRDRSPINDYKNSAYNNMYAGGNSQRDQQVQSTRNQNVNQSNDSKPKKKKGMNVTEDKVVWAGALFVFFGVFVFLIGYWLGKSNEQNLPTNEDAYLTEMEETLSEQQIETSFVTGLESSTSDENEVLSSSSSLSSTPTTLPEEPVVAPAISTATTTTSTTTTVAPTTTTTVAGVAANPDTTGSFTLQVSAHTSADSARVVEEELRAMGYQSYVVESVVSGTRYYRVRIGSFTSKNDANSTLDDLHSTELGADAYLITLD